MTTDKMAETMDKMAEILYAMDLIASRLDAGNRIEDWTKESGLRGPDPHERLTDVQLAKYRGWLMGHGLRGREEVFRDVVSSFVFLLCREAFGRVEALDNLVCEEDLFA